jgi:hypothetical protein
MRVASRSEIKPAATALAMRMLASDSHVCLREAVGGPSCRTRKARADPEHSTSCTPTHGVGEVCPPRSVTTVAFSRNDIPTQIFRQAIDSSRQTQFFHVRARYHKIWSGRGPHVAVHTLCQSLGQRRPTSRVQFLGCGAVNNNALLLPALNRAPKRFLSSSATAAVEGFSIDVPKDHQVRRHLLPTAPQGSGFPNPAKALLLSSCPQSYRLRDRHGQASGAGLLAVTVLRPPLARRCRLAFRSS